MKYIPTFLHNLCNLTTTLACSLFLFSCGENKPINASGENSTSKTSSAHVVTKTHIELVEEVNSILKSGASDKEINRKLRGINIQGCHPVTAERFNKMVSEMEKLEGMTTKQKFENNKACSQASADFLFMGDPK